MNAHQVSVDCMMTAMKESGGHKKKVDYDVIQKRAPKRISFIEMELKKAGLEACGVRALLFKDAL